MLYEVSSRRTIIDRRGNDKSITEHYLVNNVELFAEAEVKVSDLYNAENDVVAIKRSNILDIINKRENDEQLIFLATFEQTEIIDGVERVSKYKSVLFSDTLQNAILIALDNANKSIVDTSLIGIRKSKFTDLI